jgi:hypothetical protein
MTYNLERRKYCSFFPREILANGSNRSRTTRSRAAAPARSRSPGPPTGAATISQETKPQEGLDVLGAPILGSSGGLI